MALTYRRIWRNGLRPDCVFDKESSSNSTVAPSTDLGGASIVPRAYCATVASRGHSGSNWVAPVSGDYRASHREIALSDDKQHGAALYASEVVLLYNRMAYPFARQAHWDQSRATKQRDGLRNVSGSLIFESLFGIAGWENDRLSLAHGSYTIKNCLTLWKIKYAQYNICQKCGQAHHAICAVPSI
jgi:hypothetical protein